MMLAEKTVMVTGVGSGLGRECVTSALREGANVVMAARTKETLETTATELDPSGARVEAVPTDITDADDCAALVARATERFGSLDALIQVAAFEYVFGGLQDTNLDDWRTAFETNVLGALTVLRPVARSMQESGGGAVVLIGSQSMFKPSLPQAGYAASKGALLSTMYYLADELGAHNIRCNMVVPSWMWGPAVQQFVRTSAERRGVDEEVVTAPIKRAMPLGEIPTVDDVAEAVVFLSSDRARMITGQTLFVNAGNHMT
jgi:NAD(P)-dependent dehydrogenase (short-subunit alcohol dehydrogenase family)